MEPWFFRRIARLLRPQVLCWIESRTGVARLLRGYGPAAVRLQFGLFQTPVHYRDGLRHGVRTQTSRSLSSAWADAGARWLAFGRSGPAGGKHPPARLAALLRGLAANAKSSAKDGMLRHRSVGEWMPWVLRGKDWRCARSKRTALPVVTQSSLWDSRL